MEKMPGTPNNNEEKKTPDKRARVREYISPELFKLIEQEALALKEKKENEQNEESLKAGLENLIQEIGDEKSEDEQVKKLGEIMRLLPSNSHDIILRYHPEYKGLGVGYVKKIIAEYLGDFLMIKKDWRATDIEKFKDVIDVKDIKETILYILKNDCLMAVNKKRMNAPDVSESILVEEYFAEEEMSKLSSSEVPEIKEALGELKKYYKDIFALREKKPSNIVGSLKEGRTFPDINQLVNIKEIKEKKKMLIADDMGLGKSASVILAKEYMGLRCALVVMPSNVESTWKNYLSDALDENGNQEGYFKKGLAPKVLVIDSVKDIERLKTETFDYVLISQEKMNDRYSEALAEINFDMMIVDEVHKIKNIKSGVRSENVIRLAKNIHGNDNYLALLSGTPIPNKVQDIAISLKLLYPEKYENFSNKDIVNRIIYGDLIDLRSEIFMRTQMKEIGASIEMPSLKHLDVYVDLSLVEREIYEILLEEGESTASEKIMMFRQFLLNPELLDVEPGFISSKTKALEETLKEDLETEDKIIVFVNDYIEDVIRGNKNIVEKMGLPADVIVEEIHGDIDPEDRKRIENELKTQNKKMVVFVSGQTADVGVNFSGADGVIFYNEPWSNYNKKQQQARIYREGLKHGLVVKTLITKNSIEEGIRIYADAKEKAVEKLLRGIQNTEKEKNLLSKDSKFDDDKVETNSDLSQVYLSKWDRMMIHFGENRFIGEKRFKEELPKKGDEYAELYREIGPLSYQGNNARATATVLSVMIEERKEDIDNLRVLDVASGPEMLKDAVIEKLKDRIFSSDLNPSHFQQSEEQRKTLIASYLNLPAKDNSIDYLNYGFALHQTPKIKYYDKNYERLQVFAEMNRVLKPGGRAIITMLNDFDITNKNIFSKLVKELGFKIVEEYSGDANGRENYKAEFITLEKEKDIPEYKSDTSKYVKLDEPRDIYSLGDRLGREFLEGLEIKKVSKNTLRDQRRMVDTINLNGKEIPIIFNEKYSKLYEQEVQSIKDGEELRRKYGGIKNIPLEEIKNIGFERKMRTPGYYLLYKIIEGGGAVIIRGDYKKKIKS